METTLRSAGRIATRLRKHGMAAVSSFYADPGELHRATVVAQVVPPVAPANRDQHGLALSVREASVEALLVPLHRLHHAQSAIRPQFYALRR